MVDHSFKFLFGTKSGNYLCCHKALHFLLFYGTTIVMRLYNNYYCVTRPLCLFKSCSVSFWTKAKWSLIWSNLKSIDLASIMSSEELGRERGSKSHSKGTDVAVVRMLKSEVIVWLVRSTEQPSGMWICLVFLIFWLKMTCNSGCDWNRCVNYVVSIGYKIWSTNTSLDTFW